jgi:hypothetical protein
MSVKDCVSELRNANARLKDVLAEAMSNSDIYEVEVSTQRTMPFKHKKVRKASKRKSSNAILDDLHRSRFGSWDTKFEDM